MTKKEKEIVKEKGPEKEKGERERRGETKGEQRGKSRITISVLE